MTISAAQYTAWLADPDARRCVLFEVDGVLVGGVATNRYFSTVGYVTGAGEAPANTAYPALVMGGMQIQEGINLSMEASLTVGDIALDNSNGARDTWLNDVWVNRPLRAYLGDVRWPRADFRQVFAGVVADIGSSERGLLHLVLTNKLARLNTAVSDLKHGGEAPYTRAGTTVTVTRANHRRAINSVVEVSAVLSGALVAGNYLVTGVTPTTFTFTTAASTATSGTLRLGGINADVPLPVVLGEGHNVTPLLIDAARMRYAVHAGPVLNIIEVRDNGRPVQVNKDNGSGYFDLLASPAGAITASVQGDTGNDGLSYFTSVASAVKRLVTGYGLAGQRFTDADLDLASLAAFDITHPQPIGRPLTDRGNVLADCQALAATLGASLVINRAGLLRLVQLNFPPSGPAPTPIPPSVQIERTLHIVARTTVAAAVKLNYCRNWTVQEGLQTSIPAEHKELFATEWLSVTASDPAVASAYALTAEPIAVDTLLLTRLDAQAEAERRLAIIKVPRTTYRFEGNAVHLELELGQAVTLTADRFGLQAGVVGVVTALAPDWLNARVTVDVTI